MGIASSIHPAKSIRVQGSTWQPDHHHPAEHCKKRAIPSETPQPALLRQRLVYRQGHPALRAIRSVPGALVLAVQALAHGLLELFQPRDVEHLHGAAVEVDDVFVDQPP